MIGGTVEHTVHMMRMRQQLDATLERLSRIVMTRNGVHTQSVQDAIRFFGQIAAGWIDVSPEALPQQTAGYGSTVVVEDLVSGVRESYLLMTGALLNIDQGHVSLASPIGQSLLGAQPGDEVNVHTPHRQRRFRVISVRTLQQRMDDAWQTLPAA